MDISHNDLHKIGFIGTLTYFVTIYTPMSQEQKQQMVDKDSREAMYAAMQTSMMNPGQHIDPGQLFIKTRADAQARATASESQTITKTIYHQIGQKESIKEIHDIGKTHSFKGWLDPIIVSELVKI